PCLRLEPVPAIDFAPSRQKRAFRFPKFWNFTVGRFLFFPKSKNGHIATEAISITWEDVKTTEDESTMLKFYYSGAPNPMKVALFLEETGLSYDPIPIDTRKGDQHKPEYLAINPNAKVPAIVDGDVTVFDSNAILLYLAEKTGKFLPGNTPKAR